MFDNKTVYITKSGRSYHYTDDFDCPTVSRIVKGKTAASRIPVEEALSKGLTLCSHCERERQEDTDPFYIPKKRKKSIFKTRRRKRSKGFGSLLKKLF